MQTQGNVANVLLNNLSAIVLEDILVHTSYHGLRFTLTVLPNPCGFFFLKPLSSPHLIVVARQHVNLRKVICSTVIYDCII